jgi:AcrR family transcriptional regulator
MSQKSPHIASRAKGKTQPAPRVVKSERPAAKPARAGKAGAVREPQGLAVAGATPSQGTPQTLRELRGAARREAILAAALEEFSAQGFAAARLDDVAKRAGVAKGTIYLYFADKETLFQELARSMLSPLVGHIEGLASTEIPFPMLVDGLADMFTKQIIGSRRKDIIRLIIAEGPRFPSLAEFYHREVLSRVIAALRAVLQRAYDRGELRHKSLIEFPQLLAAPAMVAIIWNSLFERFAPLDARALLKAHLDILLDRGSAA